jgi:hypothetical protein
MKDLPLELIEVIATYCCCQSSSKDIASLSQVNRRFYASITRLLYKNVMIHGPRQYLSFKSSQAIYKHYVNRLDFSSYTTRGTRWTEVQAKSVVLATEIASLIGECNNLQELFVGEEMMHAFISPLVIRSIFNSKQESLRAVDFTGFCDKGFTTVMSDFFGKPAESKLQEKTCTTVTTTVGSAMDEQQHWSIPKNLTAVSFYMCMALNEQQFFIPFFDKLNTSGNQLTRLDLAHTQISSQVFAYLQNSVQSITHLNLAGCHSLTCCSPFITFIAQAKHLKQLNLNLDFSAANAGTRFCQHCIYTLLKSVSNSIVSLDMGGHLNLNDELMMQLPAFPKLEYLSISGCKNVSLQVLKQKILHKKNKFKYLNLSKTNILSTMDVLPRVLNELNCDVIEITGLLTTTKKEKLLPVYKDWKLVQQGRRFYYSKTDPRFIYSKKLLFSDQLSPMNKYWAFSY